MATLNPVRQRDCRKCSRCGTLITFVKNRNGKAYPVEVYPDPRLGLVFRSGIGAYGNLTPWHKCEDRQRQQAEFAERELQKRREAVAREWLPRFEEMAQRLGRDEITAEEAQAVGTAYKAALEAIQ